MKNQERRGKTAKLINLLINQKLKMKYEKSISQFP